MQVQSTKDRIASFLDKKFRYSKSFATKQTYSIALNKFQEFLRTKYNLDINQVVKFCENKDLDPITEYPFCPKTQASERPTTPSPNMATFTI